MRVSDGVVSVCASINDIDYCPIQLVAVIDIKPLLDGAILGETGYVDTTRITRCYALIVVSLDNML